MKISIQPSENKRQQIDKVIKMAEKFRQIQSKLKLLADSWNSETNDIHKENMRIYNNIHEIMNGRSRSTNRQLGNDQSTFGKSSAMNDYFTYGQSA